MGDDTTITAIFWAAMTLLFLVLSIPLLRGMGSSIVAGINTMSERDKARYDIPKICESVGVLMLMAAALCASIGCISFLYGSIEGSTVLALGGVLILACIIVMVYANTRCKKK